MSRLAGLAGLEIAEDAIFHPTTTPDRVVGVNAGKTVGSNEPDVTIPVTMAAPKGNGGTSDVIAAELTGTALNDTITGTSTGDVISGFDGADILTGGAGDDTLYGHSTADLSPASGNIQATLLANIGGGAVFLTSAPGDNGFAYALNKDTGQIFRINTTTGAQTEFLDIPDGQFAAGGEQGVLGLAFHPGYDTNGRFFVFLTNAAGNLEVREYHGSGNPPTANAGSFTTLITIPHPTFGNHNGGCMAFGPDGYLYIATGDGGGGNDPNGNGQNLNSLLGKILRISVDGDDFPADPTRNYAIPGDNPFAGATPGADEIWDYGLRNPWRISFDSATGDLYIGDVGQGAREEVNFEPAGSGGGFNYGWDFREGRIPTPGSPPPPPGFTPTDPVFDYPHPFGQSITGGYVYRGPAAGLQGGYFFADFVSGRLMTLRVHNGQAQGFIEHTAHVTGAALGGIASFGTDNAGHLYVVTLSGAIYRLNPGIAAGDGVDRLDGGAGNDRLFGGMRNDVLIGGTGNDMLNGGPDSDTMTGGAATTSISSTALPTPSTSRPAAALASIWSGHRFRSTSPPRRGSLEPSRTSC